MLVDHHNVVGSHERARILEGGHYKDTDYESAKILRINEYNVLFRRTGGQRRPKSVQVLGIVEDDSLLGDFELEYMTSNGKWINPENGPVDESEPQIWEFSGENDYEYSVSDFRDNRKIVEKLLSKFCEGPVTFFHS